MNEKPMNDSYSIPRGQVPPEMQSTDVLSQLLNTPTPRIPANHIADLLESIDRLLPSEKQSASMPDSLGMGPTLETVEFLDGLFHALALHLIRQPGSPFLLPEESRQRLSQWLKSSGLSGDPEGHGIIEWR